MKNNAWDSLVNANKNIKVLERLSSDEVSRASKAANTLMMKSPSGRDKRYKEFLYDVLYNSNAQYVLLCAVALGYRRAADMLKKDRVHLIGKIKASKDSLDTDTLLGTFATTHRIPKSVNDVPPLLCTAIQKRERALRDYQHTVGATDSLVPLNETQTGLIATSKTSSNKQSRNPCQSQEVLENASLEGMADVVDEYMCSAIDTIWCARTTSMKAAITMVFPYPGLVDCLMSLAIRRSEVERLAIALFNVRLESVGEVRSVVMNNGVRITPNPEITLKGVTDNIVISLFGLELYGAITASRMRRKELEEGNHETECVSMIITSNSSQGAIINLSLDMIGGARVQSKIYT